MQVVEVVLILDVDVDSSSDDFTSEIRKCFPSPPNGLKFDKELVDPYKKSISPNEKIRSERTIFVVLSNGKKERLQAFEETNLTLIAVSLKVIQ